MFDKLRVNISFLVLILFGSIYSVADLQPQFAKSWEEEFQEVAEYYTDFDIETVEQVKEKLLADPNVFRKVHYADKIISFDEWIIWCSQNNASSKVLPILKDIQKTFNDLKNIMFIPDQVHIWSCFDQSLSSGFMGYRAIERTIYVYPSSSDMCPAYRLFTLIHELTHAQQHMRSGLLSHHLEFCNEKTRALLEYEADVNAAQSIKCPLCFKAIVSYQLLRESTATADKLHSLKAHGYLLGNDLKKYLQGKTLQDLCVVHQNASNLDFMSGLDSKESLMQIYNNDCALGCMFDRLSTVKFNS